MGGLPILTYHALDDSGDALATPPAHFRATLSALHAEGFRAVDLADWVARGRPDEGRAYAVAFDDGLRSLRVAAPTLARLGVPATAFLVAGRMGRDNAWPGQAPGVARRALLGWSDLADLRASGIRFGAHTMTHPRLGTLPVCEIWREVVESRRSIEDAAGVPCPLFAYPYGDAPPPARAAVRATFAAGFGTRLAFACEGEDPTHLSRIDVYYLRSPERVRQLLAGTLGPYLAWRRAGRAARSLAARVATLRDRFPTPDARSGGGSPSTVARMSDARMPPAEVAS